MGDPGIHAIGRGLPETVLAPEPDEVVQAIEAASALEGDARRGALAAVAARWPRSLTAWARLGESARDDIEAYAYFRVGYHRGLDALRASGWRGSGYVRWSHPENHGFLGALDGLRRLADRIGEREEAARCAEFLKQLDPKWRAEPDGDWGRGPQPHSDEPPGEEPSAERAEPDGDWGRGPQSHSDEPPGEEPSAERAEPDEGAGEQG